MAVRKFRETRQRAVGERRPQGLGMLPDQRAAMRAEERVIALDEGQTPPPGAEEVAADTAVFDWRAVGG